MSNGSAFKEGTPLPDFDTTNADRSYARTGTDTDNNATAFRMVSPSTPQNSGSSCSLRVGFESQ